MLRMATLTLALALAACATPRTPSPASANAAANPSSACNPTASRLPMANCAAGFSHTQQDINATGQQGNDMGQALRMIDPSVR
ncbi:MAG: hypothetical protein JSS29_16145 [Proteobacteria bacterium]|nr:hypothetical protein [Pseudomonadota bacterium]